MALKGYRALNGSEVIIKYYIYGDIVAEVSKAYHAAMDSSGYVIQSHNGNLVKMHKCGRYQVIKRLPEQTKVVPGIKIRLTPQNPDV